MDCTDQTIDTDATDIARYNDMFRRRIPFGGVPHVKGRCVITASEAENGPESTVLAAQAVAADTHFAEENDPDGDHSFGALTVLGDKVWSEIDLYDAAYEYGTPDAPDLSKTRRILTSMFPSDC